MTDREILELLLNKFDTFESELIGLKSQVSENTEILKALEHNSEVHKAEMDNINHQISKLAGDVTSIKSTVVKGEKAYNFLQNFDKFSSSEQ
ncbi:hypothetical protein [Clostridium thailandense]|uniref:hypothetical protein n=1 Tax=Clostridium thailandense TaxID=2794346 RepID=UPI00398920A9